MNLTFLWRIEARFQAVKELVEAQLPVCIFIRELNEGIYTQTPVRYTHTQNRINPPTQKRLLETLEINAVFTFTHTGVYVTLAPRRPALGKYSARGSLAYRTQLKIAAQVNVPQLVQTLPK